VTEMASPDQIFAYSYSDFNVDAKQRSTCSPEFSAHGWVVGFTMELSAFATSCFHYTIIITCCRHFARKMALCVSRLLFLPFHIH